MCFEICISYCFDLISKNGDNIYLLVNSQPKYSLSRVMKIIRNITSIKNFKDIPRLKTAFRL